MRLQTEEETETGGTEVVFEQVCFKGSFEMPGGCGDVIQRTTQWNKNNVTHFR